MPDQSTALRPAHRQLNRRNWLIAVTAILITMIGIAVVAFATNRGGPSTSLSPSSDSPVAPEVTKTDDEIILAGAQDFIELSREGDVIVACLYVIDNGSFTNACEEHLSKRKDWRAFAGLDPGVTVTGFDRDGDKAMITTKHLSPAPGWDLSIQLVLTDRGEWKVRKLNGLAIDWEGKSTR